MEVPYLKEITFLNMVKTKPSKDIILTVIESYNYLLMALEKLNQVNIVHFDLKLENILFSESSYDPRIIDFGISIPIHKLSNTNMKNFFYSYAPEYYVWCIEIHIICFLLHETKDALSEEDAEIIATLYVGNNRALEFFSTEYSQTYLEECITQVKTYVDKPKQELIWELIGHSDTWDNYSVSVMYLRMITILFPEGNTKNTFLPRFGKLLAQNIHPDPRKRLTIADSEKQFSDIFYMDEEVENYIQIAKQFEHYKPMITKKLSRQLNSI
jgi:serine/threonine protein kinase